MFKALHHRDDPQCQMTDAETMTMAIVQLWILAGTWRKLTKCSWWKGTFPICWGKSRFNRRWRSNADLFLALFSLLGEIWKQLNSNSIYVIDSFSVAICDNCRIQRCRLYWGEDSRGYRASQKRYFYGLKIHLMVTESGQPVEFFLTSGSYSDTRVLNPMISTYPKVLNLRETRLTMMTMSKISSNEVGISFIPLRKKNSKRPVPPWVHYLRSSYRKLIETTGSLIELPPPKHIHAVRFVVLNSKWLSLCLPVLSIT